LRSLVATFRVVALILAGTDTIAAASWANDVSALPKAPTPTASAPLRKSGRSRFQSAWSETQNPAQLQAALNSAATGKQRSSEHRFWDRENVVLFSAVGGSRALDYFSTLNMRSRGRQEILLTDDIVDNHRAFAAIEAGGTAVSIGASYLFHRFRHHRLEHWTSIIHAGLSTSGAIRNYCLETAHPSTTP